MRALELIVRDIWVNCFLREDSSDDTWNEIYSTYTSPGRIYHDIDHIEEVCAWLWLNADVNSAEEFYGLLIAGLMHDYIDPKLNNAEELSAIFAMAFIDKLASRFTNSLKIMDIANSAIRSTKTHVSDNPLDQWLIDADLMRFTEPTNKYSDQIRQEYAEHPDDKFNAGRKVVLEHYLARDPFFYHVPHLDHFAKENITRQLQELEDEL